MNASDKIGEIVALAPSAVRVFEQLGIDCYRTAARSLDHLCSAQGLSSEHVLHSVKEAECSLGATGMQRNWMEQPLSSLIEHIVQRHHQFVRETFSQLHRIKDVAWERHRPTHPELQRVHTRMQLFERELVMHLRKEEDTVFPHIRNLDTQTRGEEPSNAFFKSVSRPIHALMSVMSDEHELTDNLLERITEETRGLKVPQLNFAEFRELLQSLKRDLLVHSCLEDYILFPRARKLEASSLAAR